MNAQQKDEDLQGRITKMDIGMLMARSDARTLRRAERTLHSWSEHLCNGAIQRDEETGVAYWYEPGYLGRTTRWPTADREAGALRRVKEVCDRLGLHWFHQTDPLGCALYVGVEPLDDRNYSDKGVGCGV